MIDTRRILYVIQSCASQRPAPQRARCASPKQTFASTVTDTLRSMRSCPACGEPILATAKKCKHCGEWLDSDQSTAQNPILAQQSNYGVPFRVERESRSSQSGGRTYSTSSVGFAIQGDVCPRCKISSYTNEYSGWHWLLAIAFFPLGLLVLLMPIKTCTRCNSPYGAGKKMAETVRVIAMVYLAVIILAVFGFCALAVTSK